MKNNHFVYPPSLICRLSIVKREVRLALENENQRIDENLISRCIDVGVGAVGTSSPMELISVAYNLYKQQLATSSLEKERAGRKHFALKYLDELLNPTDRIFCYIMYKLPGGTPTPTKKIRDIVAESKCTNFLEWRDKAYSAFAAIPPVNLSIKVVLQDLFIGSIRSLIHDDFQLLKEKDIDCLVVYSEFLDFGYSLRAILPLFDEDTMITIENPSVLSIPLDVFARIHKWRCRELRVCVACDTDGLTISGLIAARYLSLSTRCSHEDAVKAIKISHTSFVPMPYAENEFLAADCVEEEADQMELQAPSTNTRKNFDRCMLENSVRFYGEAS